jgi:amino acid adenylation domain-containing protein
VIATFRPPVSAHSTVLEAVIAQVMKTPDAPAVCAQSGFLTYWGMDEQANRLARYLRGLGVGKDIPVGLCMSRSPEMVIGALAIWKAGGAYVPLDPTNPSDRLVSILESAETRAVLSTSCLAQKLSRAPCPVVHAETPHIADLSTAPLSLEVAPTDLAYVIYTSGSTGAPKGVEITHGSLANLVSWHRQAFSVTAADRASHLAGLGFDAAVWELWPYLASGASVHMVEDETTRNSPELLQAWLVDQHITISFAPTPLAERLFGLSWPATTALRTMLTGGDTLHHYPPSGLPFVLVNNYGPTECTVVATSGPINPAGCKDALPSIGSAITNTEIHLLDQELQPVPAGAPGEICIAGPSLARGYRNLAKLTAERFVPHASVTGNRLYRTGDLGRLLPDGNIVYLGRLDDQIKIRGYRIEPNEIIGRLNQHPDVQQSLVFAREDSPGDKRLVAYVVLQRDSGATDNMLRDFLRMALPDYMLPSAFVQVEEFPLTPNGKIDRAALPPPDLANLAGAGNGTEPQTPIERRIAGIVSNLVNVEDVGREDNFFLLGGHSLLGAQLIAELRRVFGVTISLQALFQAPTIAALAAEVESSSVKSGSRS